MNYQYAIQQTAKKNLRIFGNDTVPYQMYQPSLPEVHKPKI